MSVNENLIKLRGDTTGDGKANWKIVIGLLQLKEAMILLLGIQFKMN